MQYVTGIYCIWSPESLFGIAFFSAGTCQQVCSAQLLGVGWRIANSKLFSRLSTWVFWLCHSCMVGLLRLCRNGANPGLVGAMAPSEICIIQVKPLQHCIYILRYIYEYIYIHRNAKSLVDDPNDSPLLTKTAAHTKAHKRSHINFSVRSFSRFMSFLLVFKGNVLKWAFQKALVVTPPSCIH